MITYYLFFCKGLIISLVFFVLIMAYRPYCTDGLNQLQACCLLVNVFTLFVGIMLIITAELEDAAKRAGEAFEGSERDAISVMVFIANLFVIVLPMLPQELPDSGIFDNFVKKVVTSSYCVKTLKKSPDSAHVSSSDSSHSTLVNILH